MESLIFWIIFSFMIFMSFMGKIHPKLERIGDICGVLVIFIIFGSMVFTCSKKKDGWEHLRQGDIVFQISKNSEREVQGKLLGTQYTNVGIIIKKEDNSGSLKTYVLDYEDDRVRLTPFEEWKNPFIFSIYSESGFSDKEIDVNKYLNKKYSYLYKLKEGNKEDYENGMTNKYFYSEFLNDVLKNEYNKEIFFIKQKEYLDTFFEETYDDRIPMRIFNSN